MSLPASGTQHTLSADGYEAVISSVGASLRSLGLDGRDLILPFDAGEPRPAFRGALLAPWPNRIVDGRYRFRGVKHQLPLTEPERGHALHGLVGWLDFEHVGRGPHHVDLRAVIEPQAGYPWRIVVETRYEIGPKGLTQTVIARNMSDTDAPWGVAAHPYLVGGEGRVDDWTLELPADEVLAVTDDRLIPLQLHSVDTNPDRFDFRASRRIGAAAIDHAFTSLIRDAAGCTTVRLTDQSGVGVALSVGGDCPWIQIHTADIPAGSANVAHRAGLAVEPMTCPPDAYNSSIDLQVLASGEASVASWTIAALTPGFPQERPDSGPRSAKSTEPQET